MTDPMTPLTAESELLLAEVHGTQMALTVFPARLRAIEAAAARRAIEGSGMVEAAREAASAMPADACPACGSVRDTGLITHADWCPLFRLYRALAARPRDPVQGSGAPTNLPAPADRGGPEEPRAVGAVWCPCLLPGGWVCESCGQPVESEPCAEHMDPEGVMVYRPGVPCPDRARTPEAR